MVVRWTQGRLPTCWDRLSPLGKRPLGRLIPARAVPLISSGMANKADVSRRALTLRDKFLALLIAGQLASLPQLPLLAAWRSVYPNSADPVLTLYDKGGREYARSAREILLSVSRMGYPDLYDLMFPAAQRATAVDIGDLIVKSGLHDSSEPLLEFVRHYRNGCAHGGRWSFVSREPKRHAVFEDLRIDRDWHGKEVAETVTPYHHVRIMEAISAHFGPPAAQDTTDSWRAVPGS